MANFYFDKYVHSYEIDLYNHVTNEEKIILYKIFENNYGMIGGIYFIKGGDWYSRSSGMVYNIKSMDYYPALKEYLDYRFNLYMRKLKLEKIRFMKPINELLLGDNLQILKNIDSDYFDLAITSPIYNKRKNSGKIIKKVEYDSYDDNIDEELYQKNQIEVLNEVYRTMKPGGSFFYNHKCRWEDGNMIHPITWLSKSKWMIKQEIVWNRKITGNLRGWRFWQADERIYWLYKPNHSKIGKELLPKHANMMAIWDIMPENKNNHPCAFPLDIPTRIIYSLFDDDKDRIVLDPYCGSGTVALAAKLFGCDYVGIDISQKYLDMANERLKNSNDYIEIYQKEIDKHFVKGITYQERKRRKQEKLNKSEE
jgi:modification methylase